MAQFQTAPPLTDPAHSIRNLSSRPVARSGSSNSLAYTHNVALHQLGGPGSQLRSSKTWTTSSGDLGLLSDTDEVEDRAIFVQEYNRLARKHGVRILIIEDFDPQHPNNSLHNPEKRGWLHRMFRSASNTPPPNKASTRPVPRHKRSVSDLAHNLVHTRRELPKVMDVQEMVRLSGKSALYLPPEYSPCCLILPTCLRATSQYLAQNVTTRGLFRIPGSTRVVNALYNYYCFMDSDTGDIASTVRCADLPSHIPSSVHDVASTFKRLLSALPGGILGSLAIFDAFLAIHSHLHGDPEFPRTKQTKVRARLLALAIGTIKSQFRRELICAVFGLLSLIGRVAEVTPREDQDGRALPTGDLMGYQALGIVFGPLLVGELLETYTMRLASPTSGLLLFPHTPQKLRRARRRSKEPENMPTGPPTVDKIMVAINITEMLISNWRDVVRQMKTLGTHCRRNASRQHCAPLLKPSNSESFVISKPQGWERSESVWRRGTSGREGSPNPETPTLSIKRQRPRSKKSASSCRSAPKPGFKVLSPTTEESLTCDETVDKRCHVNRTDLTRPSAHSPFMPDDKQAISNFVEKYDNSEMCWEPVDLQPRFLSQEDSFGGQVPAETRGLALENHVAQDEIPPRMSSKQAMNLDNPTVIEAWNSSLLDDFQATQKSDADLSNKGGLQRNKWPNKKITHNLSTKPDQQNHQTPRSSRTTMTRTDIDADQSQLVEPLSLEQHRTSYVSPREHALESRISTQTQTMRQNRPYSWEQENEDFVQLKPSSSSKRQSETSLQSQRYIHEPDYSTARHVQALKLLQTERGPVDTTKYFYSPMRVPPDLFGNSGVQAQPTSRLRVLTEPSDGRRPSKEELIDARRILRQSKTFGETLVLEHGDSAVKTAWIAQPKILEAQNRIAALPGYEENVIRPSVSAAASRHGAVKAMAARFEGQEHNREMPNSTDRQTVRTQSLASQTSRKVSNKSLRSSRSGPPSTPQTQSKPSWSSQTQPKQQTPSSTGLAKRSSEAPPMVPKSATDGEELRAATVMKTEKQQQASQEQSSASQTFHKPARSRRVDIENKFVDDSMKSPPSLGTMVPYLEQPPVAHHLNLPRPLSSTSLRPVDDYFGQVGLGTGTPTPRPGSTSILHAQIRSLQRQLDSKIEEVAQLRRQVEAQENSDIGTLSEQLREAKREVVMWRERAEAAERRVKVFERFTARLRGIREAAAAADAGSPRETATGGWLKKHDEGAEAHRHVKAGGTRVSKVSSGDDESNSSGKTEDAGIITARIRKCLHGGPGQSEGGMADSSNLSDDGVAGHDGAASPREATSRDISQSAVEIWIAAQELLYMDDDGLYRADGFF